MAALQSILIFLATAIVPKSYEPGMMVSPGRIGTIAGGMGSVERMSRAGDGVAAQQCTCQKIEFEKEMRTDDKLLRGMIL